MSTLKRVAANSFLYTASSILLRASSLIFFPIFSLYLTKSDYGILSITQSIGGLVALFASLEMGKALTRYIFNEGVEKTDSHASLIYTTLIASLIFSIILTAILFTIGPILLKPILNDVLFFPYVFVFLLSIPLNMVVDTCRVYQKAMHNGFYAFVLDTSFFSTNILLNLLFVVVFKMDVLGILLGILLNTVLYSVILAFIFYRKFSFSFDNVILKKSLSYALPLIPFSVLNILFESIDKFFLNADSGAQTSGIYYIALTFATIFSSAKESVINAFTPWLFGNINDKPEAYIAEIITTIFLVLGIIAVSISWFSKEILMILSSNPDFVEAYKYIPFTVMGLYIIFLGQLYNIKTFYFGKYNRYLFLATVAGIIADIIACYLLVEPYGINGAIAARIIAFTVHVIALIYMSTLELEKRGIYETKKMILILLCIVFLTGISVVFPFSLMVTFIKASILLLMLIGIYLNFDSKYHLTEQIKSRLKF